MALRVFSNPRIAVGLLAILLGGICLVLIGTEYGVQPPVQTEVTYADANVSPASPDATLAVMERFTDPSNIGTPQELSSANWEGALPGDPIAKYLATLSNFSLNMKELKTGIQQLDTSISAGNYTHTTEEIIKLKSIRAVAQSNLESLSSIIVILQHRQGWNSSKLQEIDLRINELQRLYDEYAAQSNQLQSQVNLRSPFLTISSRNDSAFIDQHVRIYINLRNRNGTALQGRNITISWGTEETTVQTDVNGSNQISLSFPVGYPAGNATITASFQPSGLDSTSYVSAYATTQLLIKYYSTQIKARVSPIDNLPLDFATVNGTLTVSPSNTLANRTVVFSLDGTILGSNVTDGIGNFGYSFQIPAFADNGNHTLEIIYNSRGEIYAPSELRLFLNIEREETVIHLSSSPGLTFSGASITIIGTVGAPSQVNEQFLGNLVITLDGAQYRSVTIGTDGSFSSTFFIPMNVAFGNHLIRVAYAPDDPQAKCFRLGFSSLRAEYTYVISGCIGFRN